MKPPLPSGRPPFPGPHGPMGEAGFHIPSADVSGIRRKWLDIAYANRSPAQKLDLYLPDEGGGPFPVIVHVHGGGFALCDKRDMPVLSQLQGLNRGFAVASINYRLSGEARFPAAVQDAKAAIRWLRANAERHCLDPNRIAAWGGSAGGNLSAMLCLTAKVAELEDSSSGYAGVSSEVQAAVDQFGPTDFSKMDEQLEASGFGPGDHGEAHSPESMYLGAPIAKVPDLVLRANPITYIHSGMPPILIQHGRMDHLVPYQQSLIFAEALERQVALDRFEFDILEGADHGDPAFDTDENLERVFRFLEKHLGKR